MTTILLTGETGYLGGIVADVFRSKGHAVHAVVTRTSRRLGHERTITNDASLEEKVRLLRPDVVVHLAAAYKDLDAIIDANIALPVTLMKALSEVPNIRPRLVTIGSYWQEGDASSPGSPIDFYSAAKKALSSFLSYFCTYRDAVCVELVLTGIYGPNDSREKILDKLLGQVASKRTLRLSPGEQEINLVHVNDVAKAVLLATDMALSDKSGSYLVASDSTFKLKELAGLIEDITKIKLNVEWNGEYRYPELMNINFEKEKLPGWVEKESLRDFISEYSPGIKK